MKPSNDEEHLLEQIRANPHDDQLRKVYADVLLARGDERGEYVHLALVSSLSPEQTARMRELEERLKAWAVELGIAFPIVEWSRGLPDRVGGSILDFVGHREVLRRFPIERIAISPNERGWAPLAALPELASIIELDVMSDLRSRNPMTRDDLAALCASTNLAKLRTLKVAGAINNNDHAVLATARWIGQLEELFIGFLSGDQLEPVLAQAPRLRRLAIKESGIEERGGRAIAEAQLPALEHLELHMVNLGGTGVRAVFSSPVLANVQRLLLRGELVSNTCDALASSPHTRALRHLDLSLCFLVNADVIALAAGLPALESLDLSSNGIGDPGATAIANAFSKLTSLDLTHNRLTRDGALALDALPALRELGLWGNAFPSGKKQIVTAEIGPYTSGHERSWEEDVPIPFEEIRALFAHRPDLVVR